MSVQRFHFYWIPGNRLKVSISKNQEPKSKQIPDKIFNSPFDGAVAQLVF
jgi:hypothetical protein